MADNRAYTFEIKPNGSGQNENESIHQSSPAWVLTFVRWNNRDTFRVKNISSIETRNPLVIENDCLQVSVTYNKGTLTPSMTATLVMSDTNYETALAPGDFVFVNMLNWPEDAKRVADQARARKPINGPKDGFKGLFKIQGPRKIITTDPNTGRKIVLFKINGFGFTEFNNSIYFNPYMVDSDKEKSNDLLFASYLGTDWKNLINAKGIVDVQNIIAVLIQSFIGTGVTDEGRNIKGIVRSPNVHFLMPPVIGNLLGVKGVKAAKDIYVYLFGIQKYASGSALSLSAGMNPVKLNQKFPRFFYTDKPCQGDSIVKAEFWNNIKAWAILNQYTNAPLNELFTTLRISPNNRVMPTVVFRQVPFTTDDFKSGPVTKFTNLPRWKIHPALITELDIGREEAARINFVQYFGRSSLGQSGIDIAFEIANKNYVTDTKDIQRSGLRPYIVTTQFDEPTTLRKDYRSPLWAKIMANFLIGGHLRLNGTIACAGIVDPIAVGDNLELDNTIYHIEQVNHTAGISLEDGKKIFRTTISLTNGISTDSNSKSLQYAEMIYSNAYELRKNDFDNEQILPGVSESQDIESRKGNVDSFNSTNTPFAPAKRPKKR